MRTPALFICHGSPELAIHETPAHVALKRLGTTLARPKAILAVSAHWETDEPRLSAAPHPETIYDFGGFDPRLREIRYGAPGAPELADQALALLEAAGISASRDPARGFDHGVWVPLSLVFPEAETPIAQLSIQPARGPDHHLALGAALAPSAR